MLDGLEYVWRAAEVLARADAGLRERLRAARAQLALALRRPEHWPADLLTVAGGIDRTLRAQGGADPLDTMSDEAAGQAAQYLLLLAVDVTAAFRAAVQVDPAAAEEILAD